MCATAGRGVFVLVYSRQVSHATIPAGRHTDEMVEFGLTIMNLSKSRFIPSLALGLVALVSVLVSACGPGAPRANLRGGRIEPPKPAPDFTLTDYDGNPFTLNSTRGQVVLVYFGYTSCPDVCPMTMADIAGALDDLGPAARDVRVVFVTVDPERDTLQVLKRYVPAFNPDFIGVRGTPEETKAVADRYGAKFSKTLLPNSALGYAMDHSAFIYVVDRQGLLRELMPFGTAREDITNDLEILTGEGGGS